MNKKEQIFVVANDCSFFILIKNCVVNLQATTINANKKNGIFLILAYNDDAFNPKYFQGSQKPP